MARTSLEFCEECGEARNLSEDRRIEPAMETFVSQICHGKPGEDVHYVKMHEIVFKVPWAAVLNYNRSKS